MKKILLFAVIAVCFFAGCAQSPDKPISVDQVKAKNQEAFKTTTAYVKQEAKGYQKQLQTDLHHLHNKFEAVKEDIKK